MNELYTHIVEALVDLDKREFQSPRDQRITQVMSHLEKEPLKKQPVEDPASFDTFDSL